MGRQTETPDRALPSASTRALALFAASTFFFWASMYVYVPVLPLYAQQGGASLSMVGLIVGAYGVTQFILRLPLGIWSDRVGRRKPFIAAGMFTAAGGALGLALTTDPWLLFLSRALTGVGASSWVAFTVLFSSYYPPGRAVRAMSTVTFVNGVAQVSSTYAGGWLAQSFGWSAPFYAGALFGVLGYLCTLGIHEEVRPVASPLTFAKVAATITIPLLIAVSVNAILGQYAVFVTSYTFTPLYAQELGASRADLGTLTTVTLLAYTVTMLTTSWLVDRIGDRFVVALGMAVLAVAIFATPLVDDLLALGGLQVLQGIGRGFAFPVLMGLSIRAVPQAQRATAMGVFQAVYAIGMFAGPIVGGPIAERFGLAGVFYSTGLVCLLSVVMTLVTVPDERR